jgi:hypothetical protein
MKCERGIARREKCGTACGWYKKCVIGKVVVKVDGKYKRVIKTPDEFASVIYQKNLSSYSKKISERNTKNSFKK